MPRLTVNYSPALWDLVRAGDGLLIDGAPIIDGVEVGPWFTPEEIQGYRQRLAGVPFHLHMGSLVSRLGLRPGMLARLRRYLACTDNEWLSAHVELLPWPLYLLGSRLGICLPPPDAGRAARRFVRAVERVRERAGLPVILENLPSLPAAQYHYAADPALLGRVLEVAGCGFLLDLAHARLAAAYRGQRAEEYLAALPLERVRQVHVSGIRRWDGGRDSGLWYDAHESMREEDYALLGWLLERCEPVVVTLEYFRQEGPLREQLQRLRGMPGLCPAPLKRLRRTGL